MNGVNGKVSLTLDSTEQGRSNMVGAEDTNILYQQISKIFPSEGQR
jgi:hypothetical protein